MIDKQISQLFKVAAENNQTLLDLSYYQIAHLPPEIGQLKNLTLLDLSKNQITHLPPEIGQLKNLTQLNLSKNQITHLPPEIGQLKNLTIFNLHSNQITLLPPEIGQLENLTIFKLHSNQITQLPPEISQLGNLRQLDLSQNQIAQLPPEISQLGNLRQLDLSQNQIAQLSPEINKLGNLRQLDLSQNQITQLPKEISKLLNLRHLYLSKNQIIQLPKEISKLLNLKRLDLSGNQIVQLPTEIFKLPLDIKWELDSSNSIFLKNTLISPPAIELVKKGREAVIDYIMSFGMDEKKPISEIKVLLVGDGYAGKSSLVRQLLDKEFDQDETQTHGINIRHWRVEEAKREIKVNIWDFGGQEIMHSTHQFFLSKRSLYILVLDSRKDDKTEYWLKHIESFGGDSPILVVINKIDENPSFEVNRRFLQKKYPSIKGFYRVSCKTGEGIDDLVNYLKQYLWNIEHIHTTWSKSWFNVKTKLENMPKHFVSYDDYNQLCNEEDVAEEARDTLIDFLNDLGVVLHFKDFELLDTHVLEPKWVTNAVYKIINSQELYNCNGVLKLNTLSSILKKKKTDDFYYPIEKHKYIIALMNKFELCYPLDTQTVLIPELLEIKEPIFNFDNKKTLNFLIDYINFLPKSVMPRFIVKMHQDIKDTNLRWKTGVVLENNDFKSSAIVKSDDDARKIYIKVNGERRKDYFAIILNSLRIINKSFTTINVIERVPLPDNPHITISYKHLIELEAKGIKDVIPEGTTERYKVNDLLGGIRTQWQEDETLRQNAHQIINNVNIEKNVQNGATIMHDIYNNKGPTGAQGPNAHGTVNMQIFNQIWQENKDEIDLAKLAEDLSKLKAAMKQEAESSEQFESLSNVVHAQEAAVKKDGTKTLESLSKAGNWALEIARDIGVEVAATALSKSLGFN